MGLIYVEGIVKHGGKSKRVRLLVDSGATYTVLTKNIWEELGLKPLGEMEFILADGTVIKRKISEALLELPGYGERHTPVVLGEAEDENLLGVVTLEIFGLILDPFRRELRPIRALMKRQSTPPNHTQTREEIKGRNKGTSIQDKPSPFTSSVASPIKPCQVISGTARFITVSLE